MSKILVKKALELVQNDLKSDSKGGKEKIQSNLSIKYDTRKHRKGPPKHNGNERSRILTLDSKVQRIIDQYKKDHLVDRTDENLEILNQLRTLKPKQSASQKILEFYSKKPKDSDENEPESESILFPEEPKKKKRKNK
ncbi:uncharacterized protein LOC129223380 [Uloborus diversus]|uniref:uncharacterized protein LOC129223380 n=1 Tax=Uloborus diversus TaxID=327109 RepID=UPI00240A8257|nr:uncharacterized protein LOC129223380 [Uloborus diversus]